MTGTVADAATAAEAVAAGMSAAESYMEAASRRPGLGAQVFLPSTPGPMGPVQGEGYQLSDSTPALRPKVHIPDQPTYGDQLLAGLGFVGTASTPGLLDGVSRNFPTAGGSAVVYVSPSGRMSLLDRIRSLFGRR